MNKYYKFGQILDSITPKEKTPRLSPEQIARISDVSKVILAVLGVAGLVTVAVIAPGILIAMNELLKSDKMGRKFTKKQKIQKISRSFYYLKSSGLIKFKMSGSDLKVRLTSLGKKRLVKINIDSLQIQKPEYWDGKWWQVAADIPTKQYRSGADSLRQKLKQMHFYLLQRTLWFYPYDPRPEVEYIVNYYGISRFVTVMEVSRLDKDDEKKLKEHFRLFGVL